MRLRLHRDENQEDEAPAALPFPRGTEGAPGRHDDRKRSPGKPHTEDAASAAEEALSDLQRGIDELEELLESLPFPSATDEDDGPYAA